MGSPPQCAPIHLLNLIINGRVKSFTKACLVLKLMPYEGLACDLKLRLLYVVVLFQRNPFAICLFEGWWLQGLHEHLGCHSFFLDELGNEVGAVGG